MAEYLETDGLRLRRKVRAIVMNELGEVLLIRPHGYGEGDWTLAGGGVEKGERPIEAIRREIAEELGVELEVEPGELPVSNRFIYSAEHKARRSLDHDGQDAAMFVCRIGKRTPLSLQAEEVAEARWFAANDAADAFPVAKQRDVFLQCLAAIG